MLSILMIALMFANVPITAFASAETDRVISQIITTYARSLQLSGRSSFDGWCGAYVRYQLIALGIISEADSDVRGDGNKIYNNTNSGKTTQGYNKTKYSGNNCLRDIISANGGNVYNILISWTYQYGGSVSNPGAGHATFIHAIIDNVVYYSESYNSSGIAEGSPHTRTLDSFYSRYNNSYGNAIGAVHFTSVHTHSHNTYSHNSASHPHNKCYVCSCGDVWENSSEPTFSASCAECLNSQRPGKPALINLNSSYTDNDIITFDWNDNPNTTHYYVYIDVLTSDGYVKYEYIEDTKAGVTTQLPPGSYKIKLSAYNANYMELDGSSSLRTDSDYYYIDVTASDYDPTEFGNWVTVLPESVTEEDYVIESTSMYRYRDNTQRVVYGDWSGPQITTAYPGESDTISTTAVNTFYNYYHYCCNYYDGMNNVDSIPYGSGSHYFHSIRLNYELSPKNVGDKGGATLYGSYTCEKGFKVWARSDPYVTYEYTYVTRTKNTVTDYGEWSNWQNVRPTETANRDIEEKTFYRYKLKCAHKNTEIKNKLDSTCIVKGYSGDTYCIDCNKLIVSGTELDFAEHNYVDNVVEPTTISNGYTVHICLVCYDSYVDSFVDMLILGDINGDRGVDGEDLVLLKKSLFAESLDNNCDVNEDKKIDILDLIKLKNILLG